MFPRHLAECLSKNAIQHDEFRAETDFECRCASKVFRWYTVGRVVEGDPMHRPRGIDLNGIPFFRIESECLHCKRKYFVFDDHYHGWNGFICRRERWAGAPRPEMHLWHCPRCKIAGQSGRLGIASEGYNDFAECLRDFGYNFKQEDWVDAFGWFYVSLTCQGCQTHTPGWVDYETM
jgi:hypothetical protein